MHIGGFALPRASPDRVFLAVGGLARWRGYTDTDAISRHDRAVYGYDRMQAGREGGGTRGRGVEVRGGGEKTVRESGISSSSRGISGTLLAAVEHLQPALSFPPTHFRNPPQSVEGVFWPPRSGKRAAAPVLQHRRCTYSP